MVWNSEQSPLYRTVESSTIPRASRRKIPVNVSAGNRNAEPHRKSENAALNSRGNAPRRPETSEEFCKSLPGTGIRCLSSLL